MILYHGSNVDVKDIDLTRSEVGKDFGVGFYLTSDKAQAERMAARRCRLYGGEPIISSFDFDEAGARKDGLLYREYQAYTKDWAEFILSNRANASREQVHMYDIVYGPIANDDVGFQIRRLLAGIITIDNLLEELKYKKGVTFQYFFATERSIKYLHRI